MHIMFMLHCLGQRWAAVIAAARRGYTLRSPVLVPMARNWKFGSKLMADGKLGKPW